MKSIRKRILNKALLVFLVIAISFFNFSSFASFLLCCESEEDSCCCASECSSTESHPQTVIISGDCECIVEYSTVNPESKNFVVPSVNQELTNHFTCIKLSSEVPELNSPNTIHKPQENSLHLKENIFLFISILRI